MPRVKICTMPIGHPQCRQMKVAVGGANAAASLCGATGSSAVCSSSRANARLAVRQPLASSP